MILTSFYTCQISKGIRKGVKELPKEKLPRDHKKWQGEFKCQIIGNSIAENAKLATKYTPRKYQKPVPMLVVNWMISGLAIKSVIDSGCYSTVIPQKAADRAGLGYLIDPSGTGKAKGSGVGTVQVNGLLHSILLEVENVPLPCTIAWIEELPVELGIRLDKLIHHLISIDLNEKL